MSSRAAAVRRQTGSRSANWPTLSTSVYCVDPLTDDRWPEFLQSRSQATVFHTPGWLEALRRTYGYLPVVFTTTPPEDKLTNGIVCCRVSSWLTGSRLVSVPFSDHCQPLLDNAENFGVLVQQLRSSLETESWRYVEFRPLPPYDSHLAEQSGFARSEQFYLHKLDLRDSMEKIFGNFHKKSTQDKIHRAEREKLNYEEGNSSTNLAKFYYLQLLTRRRHQLPPQPLDWFRVLLECMGENAKLRVASKDGQPIASTMTLSYKGSVVAKYGCSDSEYHRVGAMPFLLWKAIEEGKRQGAVEYDFGRSEPENTGLLNFKSNWGASCSALSYFRCPWPVSDGPREHWRRNLAKNICGRLPNPLLSAAGSFLYKHIG
jgi:CelD/BcsL family acetyltransferase involved in cellulose biosynthesis